MGLENDKVFNELFEEQYARIPKIFNASALAPSVIESPPMISLISAIPV